MRALVMAGGEGRRLQPLTNSTPKSLLRVGDGTILDRILTLLHHAGVEDVTLAVRHLGHKIEQHVESGDRFRMRVSYIRETSPLGTAGALTMVEGFDSTLVMMNGDIVTDIDLMAMLERHRFHNAALTVASRVMSAQLSVGVLDTREDGLLTAYREKPALEYRSGIGIYLVEPRVLRFTQHGERVDAPDLIARLIAAGENVAWYDHPGQWIDIGLPEDYARVKDIADNVETGERTLRCS